MDLIGADTLEALSKGVIKKDDPLTPILIRQASGLIREFCEWHIYPLITETKRVDHKGGRFIKLPTLVLQDEPTIEYLGHERVVQEWSEAGMCRLSDPLPAAMGAIQATMTHGYSELPATVEVVMASIIVASVTAPVGINQAAVGSVSSTFEVPGGGIRLSAYAKRALDGFRLVYRP